jgi:predicted transcriptional regulator
LDQKVKHHRFVLKNQAAVALIISVQFHLGPQAVAHQLEAVAAATVMVSMAPKA